MMNDIEETEEIDYQFSIIERYYMLQNKEQASNLKEVERIYIEIYEAIITDRLTIPLYDISAQYNSVALKVIAYLIVGIL